MLLDDILGLESETLAGTGEIWLVIGWKMFAWNESDRGDSLAFCSFMGTMKEQEAREPGVLAEFLKC